MGKTYILKEFGRQNFSRFHYFNFEESPELKKIFDGSLDVANILNSLRLNLDDVEKNKELIIFDEIQSCPRALSSLKYFSENAPNVFICSAGSLIGVVLSEESFPVGKVDYLYLNPFKFSEYLNALDPWAFEILEKTKEQKPSPYEHEKLLEAFTHYSIIGGLPRGVEITKELKAGTTEHVSTLADFHDAMIRTYQSDFAKHAGKVNAVHISATFSNIPLQLSSHIDGATKRYKFKDVSAKIRGYSQLQGPINWLLKAGLASQVKIVKKLEFPLNSYCSENKFKLYLFDTGLLMRMLQIPYSVALENSYGMHKGYVMENTILSQLYQDDLDQTYCWQENKAEVDFIRVVKDKICPIEVKSSHRTKSKSLKSLINRYNTSPNFILSSNNFFFNETKNTWNLPIYYSEFLGEGKGLERFFD